MPALVGPLSRPEAYPEPTNRVEVVQTHISIVFLTDRFAYKLKKPVRFDFLDFSTLEKRESACRNELRLNRRLAPQVYLDVVPVVRQIGCSIEIGGDGEIIDWLVKMRRLDERQTLRAAVERNSFRSPTEQAGVLTEQLRTLSQLLADFYRGLSPATLTPDDYRHEVEAHVRGNLAELIRPEHQLDARLVKRIHSAQLEQILLRANCFDARVSAGRVVEGHGDLRPEHIYLSNPPVVIDCIEFNAEFRRLDILDELCFLESECAELGEESIGRSIRERCLQLLGDSPPEELAAFYRSYRACVRAKVAALRARQQQGEDRQSALRVARDYLRLADRFDRRLLPPLCLLVRGVSGSGKSTLAAALAELFAAEHLQTDEMRAEMTSAGDLPTGPTGEKYSLASRARVYDALLARARDLLESRSSVILDGTFLSAGQRRSAWELASDLGATFLAFRCHCPVELAAGRVASRRAIEQTQSEAFPELVARQLAAEEPDPAGRPSCELDTSGTVEEAVRTCVDVLRQTEQAK